MRAAEYASCTEVQILTHFSDISDVKKSKISCKIFE